MKPIRTAGVVFVLMTGSLPAMAAMETISAGGFPIGTDLSNQNLPGVSLSAIGRTATQVGITTGDILTTTCTATDNSRCFNGSSLFTTNLPPALLGGKENAFFFEPSDLGCVESQFTNCAGNAFEVMKVSFAAPTDFVQMTGQFANDGLALYAFNSSGNLLGSCTGFIGQLPACFNVTQQSPIPADFASAGTLTLSSSTDDISYMIASGFASAQVVDSVSFDAVQVPEPGPLTLLAGGLVALSLASWLRRGGTARRAGWQR